MTLFVELGVVIILAMVVAYIVYLLKQPLIVAYMFTGILLGPTVFNAISDKAVFDSFAEIGIAMLLFIVGLSMNIKHIKQVGRVAFMTGIGQVGFTALVSYAITRLMGYTHLTSAYIAVALTFSSTIVVVKLLSDKGDLDKLYGRIVLGILVVQDLVAIFILLLLSSKVSMGFAFVTQSIVIGLAFIAGIYIVSRYAFPKFLPTIAQSQELLFIFSLAWCFVLSIAFHFFHFSIEIGALLAGISLASTPFASQINSKVRSIRDFFIVMFFISLASHMSFDSIGDILIPAIILSLFVLIMSPILVLMVMGWMGFSKRNSFLTGTTIAQISEFSLIVIIIGAEKGHIGRDVVSLVTLIAIMTILGSTYVISFAPKLYPKISKYLKIFERKKLIDQYSHHDETLEYRVYLFGYNRTGYSVLKSLTKLKKPYLIIDHNPDIIMELVSKGIHCKYGDADDIELLAELDIPKMEMVVSTIPDAETNMMLIGKIRSESKNCVIIMTAHHLNDALEMYEKGADYVILPHYISGDHAATIIENFGTDFDKFLEYKLKHIKDLHHKRHLKHHAELPQEFDTM